MLLTRIITAVVALPFILFVVYRGGIWFVTTIAVVALVAGWEFGRMMKAGGYTTEPVLTLGLILLLILNAYRSDLSLTCILSIFILGSLTWQLFSHTLAPTADWALTLAGGLYIGWGMAHLVGLRELGNGLAWLWLAVLATWGADTCAYLVGRTWGRHKLWPRHSPKKTWEGVFGSVFGGLGGAALVAYFSSLDWGTALIIGAIVPIVALFGDLSVSMMKRHVGVKDSSNLVPGHGGVLDRLDSLLFVSVVVYHYAVWSGVFGPTSLWFLLSGG